MPNNYILLETIALTQSAASVTFDNLPTSGYTDLKVVISARNSRASFIAEDYGVFFNGDTTTGNYSARQLLGSGSAASSRSGYNYGVLVDGNTATANTFNNTEVYIPNYRSSTAKSCSVDSVTENNATAAYMGLTARLWTGTSAITSISIDKGDSGENNSFLANSTFSLYGIAALGTTPVLAPKATGGNRVENDGTYWIHTFLSSGVFTPQTNLTCDYLVVAGGGSSGSTVNFQGGCGGGAGGAGGLRSTVTGTGGSGSLESAISVTVQNYAITVGAGGAFNSDNSLSTNGSNSTFSSITSVGGGRGGNNGASVSPGNGGSGGGGAGHTLLAGQTGGTGTSNQGFDGASSVTNNGIGRGGGGAAGAASGQAGGAGRAVAISGSSVTYAAGGNTTSTSAGTASTGNGASTLSAAATISGSNGGSGIVIIRYPIA
jgi:hypothetical protein